MAYSKNFLITQDRLLMARNGPNIASIIHNDLELGDGGVEHIVSVLKDTKVRNVDLSWFRLGGKEVKYLVRGFKDTEVTDLSLRFNNIGLAGIKYFAVGLKDTQITSLDLGHNKLGDEGAKCLATCLKDTKLAEIKLDFNNIGEKGAEYIAAGLKDSQIRALYLNSNYIKHEGTKYISMGLKDTRVTTLDLGHNDLGDIGAEYIATGLKDSKVEYLSLSSNNISEQGAKYLATGLKNSYIKGLSLSYNNIGDQGAKYLGNSIKYSQVTFLDVVGNSLKPMTTRRIQRILEENESYLIQIRIDFKLLVSKDAKNDLLTFQVHNDAGEKKSIDTEKYLSFIKSIHHKPAIVSHLINTYDTIYTGPEIVQFVENISIQFCEFLSKFLEESHYEYVKLLKRCEDMQLDFIVKDLLLNRGACTIEESKKDVLYPYVYLLLNKYKQPLLANDQAFKCNKQENIQYFRDHPDLEYAMDAIELLENVSTGYKKMKKVRTA